MCNMFTYVIVFIFAFIAQTSTEEDHAMNDQYGQQLNNKVSTGISSNAPMDKLYLQEWQQFKTKYNKNYGKYEEELKRFLIFVEHFHSISLWNLKYKLLGDPSWTKNVTKYDDRMPEEKPARDFYSWETKPKDPPPPPPPQQSHNGK